MKQSFLDSLIGLPTNEAEGKVTDEGYESFTLDKGMAVSSIARPSTVILEEDDGKIVGVAAGDPCELE